jgi:hypothetical protein
MFVGHYGPSFAIKSVRRAIPLWLLFVAVQLLDFGWSFSSFSGSRVRPEASRPYVRSDI